MSHFPKNHRLRPLYRLLAAAAGVYCVVFGIVGLVRSGGSGFFSTGSYWALGLKTNPAFSVLSIFVGVLVLGLVAIGRNLDRNVNMVLGPGFIVIGLVMMAVMGTNANILNFGMSTCIVSFLIGLVLMTSAFYGEVAPEHRATAEERFRRGAPDPEMLRHP